MLILLTKLNAKLKDAILISINFLINIEFEDKITGKFSTGEIEISIKSNKSDKALGAGEIPPGIFRFNTKNWDTTFNDIFNKLNSRNTPKGGLLV